MKLSISVAATALTLSMLASGCTSDPIPATPDRNELYDREFVREFGVPDPNHTWSDASETTLTLVSSTRTSVRVYYQENDALYLVGDITAPAGEQPVPFMVPSSVSTLIVETAKGRTSAPLGSSVNLDAISDASRLPSKEKVVKTPLEERQILFTLNNVPAKFFEVFKPRENNLYIENEDVTFATDIRCLDADEKYQDWMLYPIYWSNMKQEKQFENYADFLPAYATADDYEGRYSLQMEWSRGTEQYESGIVPDEYRPRPLSGGNPYPYDWQDLTITTYGIRYSGAAWNITPGQNFGTESLYMSDMSFQADRLNTRFWNVTTDYLNRAYNTMCVYFPKNTDVTYKVPVKSETGETVWEERTTPACFIGVSTPPIQRSWNGLLHGDSQYPDFCDVVYLVAPVNPSDAIVIGQSTATISVPNYYTFAAEDLGGSYDWDFNDVVFTASCITYDTTRAMIEAFNLSDEDVYLYPHIYGSQANDLYQPFIYRITVQPLAAGGTMPVYIAYNGQVSTNVIDKLNEIIYPGIDYNSFINRLNSYASTTNPLYWHDGITIVGTEVHKWLGATSTATPINVGGSITHTGRTVTFYSKTGLDYHYGAVMSGDNEALKNFFIIVDKENTLGIDTSESFDPAGDGDALHGITPFDGVFGEGTYKIGAVREDKGSVVPQMICTSGALWNWPLEETHISLAYPKFRDWVSDQSVRWHNEKNNKYVNDLPPGFN